MNFEFELEENKGTFDHYIKCYFRAKYCGFNCKYKAHNEKNLWRKIQTQTDFYDCEHLERGLKCPNQYETAQRKIDSVISQLNGIYLHQE